MAETPRQFWARIGLGTKARRRLRKPRPTRTHINVVMWEACINRQIRGYLFPDRIEDDELGTAYGRASVVKGEPGKAAVSAVWYDEDKAKLRSRFLGQHGATFQETCDRYAEEHPVETKPAFVIAIDNLGAVLYSADLSE